MFIPFYLSPVESKTVRLNRILKAFKHWLENQNLNKSFSYRRWITLLEEFPLGEEFMMRWNHVENYGFVILTTETISLLKDFLGNKKVLDVGAGSGYLSNLLRLRGVNVTPIDNFSHQIMAGYTFKKFSSDIIKVDVKDHPVEDYEVIILSWPHDGMETLNKMTSGQILIYQGESCGGCTGSEEFFDTLSDPSQFVGMEHNLNKYHLKFSGIHDYWEVYQKL